MPEFEEENVNASPSESYTPSTDASKKPRTRRRSGGFKTEVANVSNANIGEVSANQALKEEKLSGTPSATHTNETRETSESQGDREDRPRRERKPRQPRGEREPRTPREPRTDANPQPSPETLAAIASVEAKIAERRAERDARRAERDKSRPAKTERSARKQRKSGGGKPAQKKKGLLASILSIFGLGSKTEPAKKRGGNRGGANKGRGRRPQGKGGDRRGQNRGRGGQNRRRGGQGGNRNNGRSKENSES
jgi:ribonuclease E